MTRISLANNVDSIRAIRSLNDIATRLAAAGRRLSSGSRINSASDDAAGLAIADSLRANSRVFSQGIRNFNDGISLLNIAESALTQLSEINMRQRELAEQAANGVYSSRQRHALDSEAQALTREYNRILSSTSFNGISLFANSDPTIRLQGGYGLTGGISFTLGAGITNSVGDGTFTQLASFSAAGRVSDFASGDFNEDGNLDLAIPYGYSSIQIFAGAGDGTFSSIGLLNQPEQEGNITAGDVNGDGNLDLVMSSESAFMVYLGNGNGSFKAAVSYDYPGAPATAGSKSASLADIDQDGDVDVLLYTANYGGQVYRNNGDGTYAAPMSIATVGVLGDLNGDGKLDMVEAPYLGTSYFKVHIGNGNGSFQAGITIASSATIRWASPLADFNGDGNLDIGFVDSFSDRLFVHLGDGAGGFSAATSFSTSMEGGELVLDTNGDGNVDIVGFERDTGHALYVMYGNGNGTFRAEVSFPTTAASHEAIEAADVNGDGVLDMVLGDATANTFTVMLANTVDGAVAIDPPDLSTILSARESLDSLALQAQALASDIGKLGAVRSRIEVAIGVMQSIVQQSEAARGRIADADIAAEQAEYVRLKILQQAGLSVLAQANTQPALALRLLE